jgi:hypothetical protein
VRTQGILQGDTGYPDGHVFIPAAAGFVTGTAGTWTRGASGNNYLVLGNSSTSLLTIPLGGLLFRYGMQDWLQENFGSGVAGGAQGFPVGGYTTLSTSSAAAGSNVNVPVLNSSNFTVGRAVLAGTQKTTITAAPDATHITLQTLTATLASASVITENLFTTPAGVSGAAPYPGNTYNTPPTAPRPKGIAIKEIYPVYLIAGAALTTNTIGLTKTVFANATAPAVTNLLADAANGLATATQAAPYVTPIQIPTPAFQTTKYSEYTLEWDITTAGGGTADIYGVFLDLAFNYV